MSLKIFLSIIVFSLVLIGLISASSYGQVAEPIKVTSDKTSYVIGDKIVISGEVEKIQGFLILSIFSPNDEIIFSSNLMISYSKFSTELTTGGALWESSGTYTVTVESQSDSSSGTTTFELTSDIPAPVPKPSKDDEKKAPKLIITPEPSIPDWIRNNAKWWSEGSIGDSDFISGIQYLMEQGILQIPKTAQTGSDSSDGIPDWIKNNAGWWADEMISDDDFVNGIQYLVQQGTIKV